MAKLLCVTEGRKEERGGQGKGCGKGRGAGAERVDRVRGQNGAGEMLAAKKGKGRGEEGLGRRGRMGSLTDWRHALYFAVGEHADIL